MGKVIDFENVSFSYNQPKEFIKGLSFSIDAGSYVCLLGSNGSGKSTIAKLMCGLLRSQSGDIFVDGEIIRGDSLKSIRKSIGMVFQNPDNQFVAPTLKEDIIFGLENHYVNPKEMDSIIDSISRECGVDTLLDKSINELSGGQKQKGAIAGILAIGHKVLVLDEATSMLDPISKKEVFALIEKLKKEKGLTIVSITHNSDEIFLADRVLVMDKGRLVFDGKRDEFFKLDTSKYGIELPNSIRLQKLLRYSFKDGEVNGD